MSCKLDTFTQFESESGIGLCVNVRSLGTSLLCMECPSLSLVHALMILPFGTYLFYSQCMLHVLATRNVCLGSRCYDQ